jgi:hypothetical protein
MLMRISWLLYNTMTMTGFIITTAYWSAIYQPGNLKFYFRIHSAMFSFFELLRCPRRCHVDPQTWLQLRGFVNGPCNWSTTLQTPAFLSTACGCHQLSLLYFDLLDFWGQEPRRKRSHQHILRLEQFRYQVAGFICPISRISHPNFYLVFACPT